MEANKPYPYRLHTNRELELMLNGMKPLAVFTHECVEGFEKSDALNNQDFDVYVASGAISEHKRSFRDRRPEGGSIDIDYYFYTLKGEEWRVEAYVMLLEALHQGNWCSHLEWLQGKLLGYTDEQNRYHLARQFPGGHSDCTSKRSLD